MEGQAVHEGAFVLVDVGAVVGFEFGEEGWAGEAVVEGVDHEGVADGQEVDADLVGFAGFGEDAEEGVFAELFFDPPLGKGGAAVPGDGHAVFLGGVVGDGGVDGAGFAAGPAAGEGEVFLFY